MSSSLLNWPSGFERTPPEERTKATKFSTGFRKSQSDLKDEMRRMGVDEWRLDDVTGSGGDPGVVLRWKDDGVEYAVACDAYKNKKGNIRAVYLYVKETRKRNDRPVVTGNDEFAAARLPSGDEEAIVPQPGEDPYTILDVDPTASEDEIRDAFREKAKQYNPDKPDGDAGKYRRVKDAYETLVEG